MLSEKKYLFSWSICFRSPCKIKLWRALHNPNSFTKLKALKRLNHAIVTFSYESTPELYFSHGDADIICNSGDFYIRARRLVSRNAEALVSAFCQAYVVTCGTNVECTRHDATYQRNFLFARGEVPSTEPLLLPAREIRYEVYPCIFEDRCRCPTLDRTCCAQNSLDLFTVVRLSHCQSVSKRFWSACNIHIIYKQNAQFIIVFEYVDDYRS